MQLLKRLKLFCGETEQRKPYFITFQTYDFLLFWLVYKLLILNVSNFDSLVNDCQTASYRGGSATPDSE